MRKFKKISEYKDEEAIELMADILKPLAEIGKDEHTREFIKENYGKTGGRLDIVSYLLKKHKHEVFMTLAALERTPIEKYHCDFTTLPLQVLSILNDEDFMSIFFSQEEPDSKTTSGSVTENIKGKEN